jgi:hypothetical protein
LIDFNQVNNSDFDTIEEFININKVTLRYNNEIVNYAMSIAIKLKVNGDEREIKQFLMQV